MNKFYNAEKCIDKINQKCVENKNENFLSNYSPNSSDNKKKLQLSGKCLNNSLDRDNVCSWF